MSDLADLQLSEEQEQLIKVIAGLAPANAQQVGAALGKLSVHLQKITELLGEADERATEFIEEYELAFDIEFVKAGEEAEAKGERVTDTMRKTVARIKTADLRLQMELAKLEVRKLKNAHKTLDRRLDIGRTQAATVRSEHRSIGYAS